MNTCILMGSPRKKGNTNALLEPFVQSLEACGASASLFWLYDQKISGCLACRACQKDWDKVGCAIRDDMQAVFEAVLAADLIVLATPIYSWYCTAPMKAALDRMVYGLNKYYGEEKGPSLWAGKSMALLLTCGYKPDQGADLFVEGMRRYCKHSGLHYAGMHAERHLGYKSIFLDEDKIARSKAFANSLIGGEKAPQPLS